MNAMSAPSGIFSVCQVYLEQAEWAPYERKDKDPPTFMASWDR